MHSACIPLQLEGGNLHVNLLLPLDNLGTTGGIVVIYLINSLILRAVSQL
jgi:hypothetical protein